MNTQTILDKSSIALSLTCAIHCLALPVITVMSPALLGSFFADEAFHQWLAFVVLPLSFVALLMGCRNHKSKLVITLCVSGLLTLLFTALLGHDLLGETGEKIATVIGASLIAVAHYKNYKLCQKDINCNNTH